MSGLTNAKIIRPVAPEIVAIKQTNKFFSFVIGTVAKVDKS